MTSNERADMTAQGMNLTTVVQKWSRIKIEAGEHKEGNWGPYSRNRSWKKHGSHDI